MRRAPWRSTLLILLSLPAWVHAKDLTVRQRTTIIAGPNPNTHEAVQYWTATKMVNDDTRMRMVVDLDAKTVTMVDKERKTYSTRTFDEMRQQAEAMKSEMNKRLAQLPPQAKAMMGQLATPDAPVTLKSTGKTEQIAGYAAKEYTVAGDALLGSVWVADALPLPVGTKEAEALGKTMAGAAVPGGKMFEAMATVKGLPLRTTMTVAAGPQQLTTTTEVVEVSEKAPPRDVLQVPDGFKQTAAPSFKPHAP